MSSRRLSYFWNVFVSLCVLFLCGARSEGSDSASSDRASILGIVRRVDSWSVRCRGRALSVAERGAVAAGMDPVVLDQRRGCVMASMRDDRGFKTPEALEGTIEHGLGLALTDEERWTYFHALHELLGGASPSGLGSAIEEPNELYVIASANLSGWLAARLVARQAAAADGEDYVFEGQSLDPEDDDGCYADPMRAWCDARDGIALGDFAEGRLTRAALSVEQRKRLRHNIRDLGEFLLLDAGPGIAGASLGGRDLPDYLLDEVLLPELGEEPITREREEAAWAAVLDTLILSGAFFVEL